MNMNSKIARQVLLASMIIQDRIFYYYLLLEIYMTPNSFPTLMNASTL